MSQFTDTKQYIDALFRTRNIMVDPKQNGIFEQFVNEQTCTDAVQKILHLQHTIMANWELRRKADDILSAPWAIPNGTVDKPYHTVLNFAERGLANAALLEVKGTELCGLNYDASTATISGTPTASGDFAITIEFRLAGEDEGLRHTRKLPLIINPNPKSLWKNLPSDTSDPYWKEDDVAVASPLGDRHIVVASKRGRSHANVGSFRDDDFAYTHLPDTGWSIVAVSDGAGSAPYARKGAQLACDAIINYFSTMPEGLTQAEELFVSHFAQPTDDTSRKIQMLLYDALGKAAFSAYKRLEDFAKQHTMAVKDLHATLIFTLVRRYSFGYAILTFGVGDCPVAVLTHDAAEVHMMNWLDVGEYGGGTRFITMPEIFQDTRKFASRLSFRLLPDFQYIMLMTDGIYDPKFVVEANLEKPEKWQEFLEDLRGRNEEGIKVRLEPGNTEVANQLSGWMDFWSPGNHDDRTLAIIY